MGKGREGKKSILTTDSMPLDLLGQFLEHIDFPLPRHAGLEPLHDLFRPFTAFSARRTLPATLVLVETRQSGNRSDNVGALVHDDHRRGAQPGLTVLERVEIHQLFVADAFGQDGCGGAAGDDGFEVVPTTAYAATVFLNELLKRDRHFFLNGAGVVDVA